MELAKSLFLTFFKIRSIGTLFFWKKEDAMTKSSKPFTLILRTDSKSFRLTLNHSCGLPDSVCKAWYRRSLQHLPEELSPYRNPRKKSDAEASAVALIAHLKMKQGEAGSRCAGGGDITVGEFARDMFTHGAAHIKRGWKRGIS
jgi:hypothetical protein